MIDFKENYRKRISKAVNDLQSYLSRKGYDVKVERKAKRIVIKFPCGSTISIRESQEWRVEAARVVNEDDKAGSLYSLKWAAESCDLSFDQDAVQLNPKYQDGIGQMEFLQVAGLISAALYSGKASQLNELLRYFAVTITMKHINNA